MTTSPNPFQLTREDQLTAILGEPPDFVLAKIADRVDASAAAFIAQSPLVFVGTVGRDGRIDVSPKGDVPGSVHLATPQSLLIAERKGNNLAYGPRNILATGRIGLIFVVPSQRGLSGSTGSQPSSTTRCCSNSSAHEANPRSSALRSASRNASSTAARP